MLKWVGQIAVKYLIDKIIEFFAAIYKRYKQKQDQKNIDEENLKKYQEVKEGKLTDAEEIKRTEDLLSGRKS